MDGTSIALSQITLGAIASWVLERLKSAKWFPLLTEESDKLVKVFAAALTSFLAITGLSYVYDPVAHTLLIQNFGLSAIGAAAWHWVTQFIMQEAWYQNIFNKVEPPSAPPETQSVKVAAK